MINSINDIVETVRIYPRTDRTPPLLNVEPFARPTGVLFQASRLRFLESEIQQFPQQSKW